jgi:hypothetical protein
MKMYVGTEIIDTKLILYYIENGNLVASFTNPLKQGAASSLVAEHVHLALSTAKDNHSVYHCYKTS